MLVSSLQFIKALRPIVLTEDGIETLVSFSQLKNALAAIFSTPLGIATEVTS